MVELFPCMHEALGLILHYYQKETFLFNRKCVYTNHSSDYTNVFTYQNSESQKVVIYTLLHINLTLVSVNIQKC